MTAEPSLPALFEALKQQLTTPLGPALKRIAQAAGELFGAEAHFVFDAAQLPWAAGNVQGEDGNLQEATGAGGGTARAAALAILAARTLERTDVVVLDLQQDPEVQRQLGDAAPPGFYAGTALSCGGVPMGVLYLLGAEARASFGARERERLAAFAALATTALDQRRSLQLLAEAEALWERTQRALGERLAHLERATQTLRRRNQRLRLDARHDALTGLPNRTFFFEQLDEAVGHAARPFALLFLDFDRFKLINDSLGHAVGDEVLVALAQRLRRSLKEGDILARFGGDEFSVLLYDVTQDEAVATAERLRRRFQHPIAVGARKLQLGVSIGVVASAFFYLHPEDMLQDADIAMYQAKARGKRGGGGAVVLFNARMRDHVVQRLSLEDELREALRREALEVYYQPIVTAAGETVAFEALARWPHPLRGFIPPDAFIPVAEEAGLIAALDRYVLSVAAQQVAVWNRQGHPCALSVNLSSRHLHRPGLVAFVRKTLRRSGLPARQLLLELTESALLEDDTALIGVLHDLKKLGLRLSLDDFGTGYSALSYLQRVPLDNLKIDRAFVQGMTHVPKSAELVKTILAMAQALGLGAVAEGVETPAQREALAKLGCTYLQGFLFAPPFPADAAEAFLKRPTRTQNSVPVR